MTTAANGGGYEVCDLLSHELRTPLTIVKTGIDILSRTDAGAPENEWVFDGMHRAVSRLEELVRAAEAVMDAVSEPNRGRVNRHMEAIHGGVRNAPSSRVPATQLRRNSPPHLVGSVQTHPSDAESAI